MIRSILAVTLGVALGAGGVSPAKSCPPPLAQKNDMIADGR